jgi:putative transcriptional regulator
VDNDMFSELLESVRDGIAIMRKKEEPSRVFHYSSFDVLAIRKKYNVSQQEFAALLGISVNTLQNWEQGRRVPTGTARVLLEIAANHPDVLIDTLKKTR